MRLIIILGVSINQINYKGCGLSSREIDICTVSTYVKAAQMEGEIESVVRGHCARRLVRTLGCMVINHSYHMHIHLHQSTPLTEVQKALESNGCKLSLINLLIVPHTLGTLTANITCCIIFYRLLMSVKGM